VNELIETTSNKQANNIEKAAASQYLSQFYNGIENILNEDFKNTGSNPFIIAIIPAAILYEVWNFLACL
jgi:hypothetical protein